MLKNELPQLGTRLNQLAEVYERKAITAAALEVWFDALRSFALDAIFRILTDWPKEHQKMPTPADVCECMPGRVQSMKQASDEANRRATHEIAVARAAAIQPLAAEYCERHGIVTVADCMRHVRSFPPMPAGESRERIIARWRGIRNTRHAAYRLREMADQALANLHATAEREPGSDDE